MHTSHDSSHHCLTNQRPLSYYISPSVHAHPTLPLICWITPTLMTSNPFVHWVYFFTPQDPSHCAVILPHHSVQYCANIADEVVVNVVQSLVPLSFFLSDSRSLPQYPDSCTALSHFFYPLGVFSLHYRSFFFRFSSAVREVIR
jgi:hypothetical protein